MLKYTEMQIQSALTLLNQISTKGLENARRVVMIEEILQHPTGEEKDSNGNDSEEKQPVSE